MSWDAVTHRKLIWGYPLALECVSLIGNKKLVPGKPPAQLSGFPAFAKELKGKGPKLIAIMWDYKSRPTLAFPFLASAGAYSFKRNRERLPHQRYLGATMPAPSKVLKAIIDLIIEDVLPKGSTQSVMDEKMSSGSKHELNQVVAGEGTFNDILDDHGAITVEHAQLCRRAGHRK